jgi:hypothetical protein
MRRKLLFLLLAVPFACEASSDPPGSGSGDGSRFIDDFAALLCDLTAQCCAPRGFSTPTDCLANAKQQLHREIDPGAQFDPVAGEKCMAAYRALAPSCPNVFPADDCKKVFTGTSSVDAGCNGGCAPSDAGKVSCLTYSSSGPDGAVTESGQICQLIVMAAPGQACDAFGRMAVERRCDFTNGSNCIQGVCSTPKPIGSACTSNTSECVAEATCSSGFCVARVPIGGACTGSQCVTGAFCENGTCKEASRWKKYCSGDFN